MYNTVIILALISLALPTFAAKKTEVKPLGNPNAPRVGTFYYNLQLEPATLNPITSTDIYNSRVRAYVLDDLMERNADTYEWEPNLAEKIEVSPDGKTFTVTVREGATWHDGQPVTAEDVAFSLEVVFDETYNAAHMRPYFEGLEPKAEVVDKRTVRFKAKNKYFGNFNTVAGLTVLPKHFYGNAKEGLKKNKTMLGSGPYKIEKYDQGQGLVLVRNDKWWGWNEPRNAGHYNFDHIYMRFIKDENIALERLKKGDIDREDFGPEVFEKKAVGPEWGKSVIKQKIENLAPKGYGFIGWNMRKPMFQSRDVRVALTYLINREEMIKKFRFGYSLPATGPWYQQSAYANPKVKAIPFDPKKAGEILKKAGWTDSDKNGVLDRMVDGKKEEFAFTLSYANKDNEKYWTFYQEDLKKAGIKMELQHLEWNAFIKVLDQGTFDAVTLGWSGGDVDLDPKQIWHSSFAVPGGSNFIAYKNPDVDKLIDQAREEMDKKKRITLLQKVYQMIADDAPYIFLFNDRYGFYGHTSRMKYLKPTYGYGVGTDYWWIQQ